MHPKFLIGSLAFFLVAGSPIAQQAPPPPGISSTSAKTSPPSSKAEEPYVIELLQNKVVFQADGKGSRDLVMRAQIKSESAVREFGLLPYPFAASFESIEVLRAQVRKP